MILRNNSDRKALVRALEHKIKSLKLNIKYQKLLDIFALSQQLRGENELVSILKESPLYLETSKAAEIFSELVALHAEKNSDSRIFRSQMFLNVVEGLDRYPVVAGFDQHVKFDIDWFLARTSSPYVQHDSYLGQGDFDEWAGNKTGFVLGNQITEEEFNALKNEIEPFLQIVEDGFEYVGHEERPVLSESAIEAQNDIKRIIESAVIHFRNDMVIIVDDYFGEEFPCITEIEGTDIIEVEFNNSVYISHKTTDLELQKLVAKEVLRDDRIKDEHLFYELIRYRDACRENLE